MGNACTNCTPCRGDGGENGEILTVDHKVSLIIIYSLTVFLFQFRWEL